MVKTKKDMKIVPLFEKMIKNSQLYNFSKLIAYQVCIIH